MKKNTENNCYFCKIRSFGYYFQNYMNKIKQKDVKSLLVGLVDADLLDNGTRHPNLVLLKIAGFLKDNNIPFELILDPEANISGFDRIYLSRVFSFTRLPAFFENADEVERQTKFP